MIVGEVGIPRDQFLYILKMWEIIAIQRGYHRRCARMMEPARFTSFCVVNALGGNLKSLQDLVTFPWEEDDDEDKEMPTDEEIERLREQMRMENEALEKARVNPQP